MYKLCKSEQSAARQRQIEEGLLKIMASRSYETITVTDICQQMDIPRKAFYRYFSGKDGALHALIDHTFLEFEGFPPHGCARGEDKRIYETDLKRFFCFWQTQKALLDALTRSNLSQELITRSVQHTLSSVVRPNQFLQHEEQLTRYYATTFGVSGLMSMVLDWYRGGFELSPRQMAAIAVRLMTNPLFSEL